MKTRLTSNLIAFLILASFFITLASAESISLDSNSNPSKEINLGGNAYTVSLISASDTAAMIRVTHNQDTQAKEVSEGSTKIVNGLSVKVNSADETNFFISATVDVSVAGGSASCTQGESSTKEISEGQVKVVTGLSTGVVSADETNLLITTTAMLDTTALTLTSSSSSQQLTVSESTYTVEIVSASDTAATIKVNSESKEITEGTSKKVGGIYVGVINADETNLQLSATLLVGKDAITLSSNGQTSAQSTISNQLYTIELIAASDTASTLRVTCGNVNNEDPEEGIVLTSNNPSKQITVEGRTYTVELISASDNVATLRLSNQQGESDTKEINEGSQRKMLDAIVKVNSADETNIQLTASVEIMPIEIVEIDGSGGVFLTSESPIKLVKLNNELYTVELISASDNAATMRVTDKNNVIDTKEIQEDSSKEMVGIQVGVSSADETNLQISTSLVISEIVPPVTPTEEPVTIPKPKVEIPNDKIAEQQQQKAVCNGCALDDICYPFGYRTNTQFCSGEGEFADFLVEEMSCNNNFECGSNICVSGECVSPSLIQKIIAWFSKLSGNK